MVANEKNLIPFTSEQDREEAKKNGEGHSGGYKVTYEGEKFNLYRIPGVI